MEREPSEHRAGPASSRTLVRRSIERSPLRWRHHPLDTEPITTLGEEMGQTSRDPVQEDTIQWPR